MLWYEKELLSPGGVVVPGYTALFLLTNPIIVVFTLIVALLTALVIHYGSRFTILYGRRRFGVTMLTALSLTLLIQPIVANFSSILPFLFTGPSTYQGFQVIGIIIPGLVANEMHRQGTVPTLSTLAIISAITAVIIYTVAIIL